MLALLMLAISGAPFWEPIDNDLDLARAVAKIESVKNGKRTDFKSLEDIVEQVLDDFPDRSKRGILLFHVVNVYAQSGMQHRNELIKHARAASPVLVEPTRRAALHAFAGDAFRLGAEGKENSAARREAATWYLNGLNELERLQLPKTPPPMELWTVFDLQDPVKEEELEKEQAIRMRKSQLQRTLLMHKKVLKSQVVSMYEKYPDERGVLARLCSELLDDDAVGESILTEVSQKPKDLEVPKGLDKSNISGRFLLVAANIVVIGVSCIFVYRRRK